MGTKTNVSIEIQKSSHPFYRSSELVQNTYLADSKVGDSCSSYQG